MSRPLVCRTMLLPPRRLISLSCPESETTLARCGMASRNRLPLIGNPRDPVSIRKSPEPGSNVVLGERSQHLTQLTEVTRTTRPCFAKLVCEPDGLAQYSQVIYAAP